MLQVSVKKRFFLSLISMHLTNFKLKDGALQIKMLIGSFRPFHLTSTYKNRV